ncbi:DUF2391 family protein [Natronorubrum aibiense]|uniref:DUF2391 family protein n=1 Tax=Natronorubrum aibiense TaxID=348826 RepID=A0A5P9P154_9EURY|nr:DUF2391 family protein [Natronorubrum aibiense]QFU81874.1 DUF2391 family protein [Natronorubrum aibiense]
MARSTGSIDETTMDDLYEQLETLAETVDDPEERTEVRRTMRLADRLSQNGMVGRVITEFTSKDKAEAFVGSVVVGLPLLVEDGVLEIGEFLAATPAFFVVNLALAVALVIGILYVADFREVQIHNPYFGVLPRRPVWVVGIAFTTAAAMMTLWGRVTWDEPWITLCQVSVIATAMAIGGSLGDIIPGEE